TVLPLSTQGGQAEDAMKNTNSFLYRTLLALTVALCPQATYAAETVATAFPNSLSSTPAINGYDLFGSGLYWWQGGLGVDSLQNPNMIGVKGSTSPSTTPAKPFSASGTIIGGAARDFNFVYYAASS